MYKFTFSINHIDLFNSSMNFRKSSKTIFVDIIFTFCAFAILIYSIINKSISNYTLINKIVLAISCILFPIIQPLIIYFKSIKHANALKGIEVTLQFNDDNISISSKDEHSVVEYKNIYNFIKYSNMIVIMYDSIHGQIIPDRVFNNNKEDFYNFVSEKIKYARLKQ